MSVDQQPQEMIRARFDDAESVENVKYEVKRWDAGGYVSFGVVLSFDPVCFYCAPRRFKGVTRQAWRLAVLAPTDPRAGGRWPYPRALWGDGEYSR